MTQSDMDRILPARKPEWLKAKSMSGEAALGVRSLMQGLSLYTVCEEAGCPNCGECFGRKSAAFLIMGSICTRNCRFCQVSKGRPQPLDPEEPANLAEAVAKLGLRHVVVTSVTRDDLADGGAGHFADVIQSIRSRCQTQPPIIEVLIPDFQGNPDALATVVAAHPDVLNHNIETVPLLYPEVRPAADYRRSLAVLEQAYQLNPDLAIKSGLMVGLGETAAEIYQVMADLREHHCGMLTIGQYLAPSRSHLPVREYIHPDMFAAYREKALQLGFAAVASGPLVRSSYMAEQLYQT
ncbi:MAG TPA: lipoyl synthase [Clostridiales bacterium]|nr:lipoyl synthase [Clostridiales bacterium]